MQAKSPAIKPNFVPPVDVKVDTPAVRNAVETIKRTKNDFCRLCNGHNTRVVIVKKDARGSVCSKCIGTLYYRGNDKNNFRTIHRAGEKIGRNDPCCCNSGKKFKRCCGC